MKKLNTVFIIVISFLLVAACSSKSTDVVDNLQTTELKIEASEIFEPSAEEINKQKEDVIVNMNALLQGKWSGSYTDMFMPTVETAWMLIVKENQTDLKPLYKKFLEKADSQVEGYLSTGSADSCQICSTFLIERLKESPDFYWEETEMLHFPE
jgi:hypothetical protein